MPLEFHNRQTPLPFGISILFLTSFFHSVTPINAYPRLYPNNTRQLAYSFETKLLTQWPCWADLAIKNCQTHYCFFSLFPCVVFKVYKAKQLKIQTVEISRRSKYHRDFNHCSLHTFYTACSVHKSTKSARGSLETRDWCKFSIVHPTGTQMGVHKICL